MLVSDLWAGDPRDALAATLPVAWGRRSPVPEEQGPWTLPGAAAAEGRTWAPPLGTPPRAGSCCFSGKERLKETG